MIEDIIKKLSTDLLGFGVMQQSVSLSIHNLYLLRVMLQQQVYRMRICVWRNHSALNGAQPLQIGRVYFSSVIQE